VVSADQRSRIVDAVEIGYREAGEVIFEIATRMATAKAPQRLRFSQRFECKNDGSRYEEPEPRLFSFTILMALALGLARASATPSISISTSSSPTKADSE